jgi:hypothetical protein
VLARRLGVPGEQALLLGGRGKDCVLTGDLVLQVVVAICDELDSNGCDIGYTRVKVWIGYVNVWCSALVEREWIAHWWDLD